MMWKKYNKIQKSVVGSCGLSIVGFNLLLFEVVLWMNVNEAFQFSDEFELWGVEVT